MAVYARRIYGCGLHSAFYIKENWGERTVGPLPPGNAVINVMGKNGGTKIYQEREQSTAFAEKCVREDFVCAVRLRGTELEVYLIRMRKGTRTTKNKIIKISTTF